MMYHIGDQVCDEDGNTGIVVIRWNDGDICEYENDAAHPNPILIHGEEKPWPGPDDILKARGKEPSTPTRKDWEEWAERLASDIWGDDGIQQRRYAADLLSIPCATAGETPRKEKG